MRKKITLPLLGAHVSIAGGLHKAVERAEALGGTTMQIFTKNSKSWFAKPLEKDAIEQFQTAMKKSNLSHIMAHASYLINIASPKPHLAKSSISALKHELHRCEQLGIPYLVLHPGAHTGAGEEKGLQNIIKNLNAVLAKANGTTKILLEAMAGQGTGLGHKFEHLKEIYKNCTDKKHLGICLDTCHIFSAGYNIATEKGYNETIEQFDKILGIKKIKAIHLNDTKTPFDSRKDRHESLGFGEIPLKAFRLIMNQKEFESVPKILETPDPDLYEEEIKKLKKMVKK